MAGECLSDESHRHTRMAGRVDGCMRAPCLPLQRRGGLTMSRGVSAHRRPHWGRNRARIDGGVGTLEVRAAVDSANRDYSSAARTAIG